MQCIGNLERCASTILAKICSCVHRWFAPRCPSRRGVRFARALQPEDMAATICGSPLYMAPEILRHEKSARRRRCRSVWPQGMSPGVWRNPPSV